MVKGRKHVLEELLCRAALSCSRSPSPSQLVRQWQWACRFREPLTAINPLYLFFDKVKAQDGRHQRSEQGAKGTGLLTLSASEPLPRA